MDDFDFESLYPSELEPINATQLVSPVCPKINTVICGDAAKVLTTIEPDSIDMVMTSPPYDLLRTYTTFRFDFNVIAGQLYSVLKRGGVLVWVVGDATVSGSETGTSFKQALAFKETGFNLHDTMIYRKCGTGACGSNRAYWQAFEYMFILAKGTPSTFNPINDVVNKSAGKIKTNSERRKVTGEKKIEQRKPGGVFSRRTNVWDYAVGVESRADELVRQHPAVFPLQLAIDHINTWSNPGDIVLDPFFGSGTTGVACQQSGRNYIGIDISQEYCDLATLRLSKIVNIG